MRDLAVLRSFCRNHYHVDIAERTRVPEVVRPRWIAMYALFYRGYSYSCIADAMGFHHSTVMHGVAKVIESGWRVESKRLLGAFERQAA